MALRYSIRLSGAGGHGLIQAARILAEAAAIYDNKNAAESCSYGPESRGNASRAEIIISDEDIDYPRGDSIDLLVTTTQEAYDKYIGDLKTGGMIVTDCNVATGPTATGRSVYLAPLTEIAEKECGRAGLVNIVALGFIARVCTVVREESICHAILARVPKMAEEEYIKAFQAGSKAATRQIESKTSGSGK
jgi:2-oxoglutarate ferredoxin oxidoreductase subunit gamma